MKNTSWDNATLDLLKKVNHLIHDITFTNTAGCRSALEDIEAALCSGDGLSAESPFVYSSEGTPARMATSLGLVPSAFSDGEMTLEANAYGIEKIHFARKNGALAA